MKAAGFPAAKTKLTVACHKRRGERREGWRWQGREEKGMEMGEGW